MMGSISTDEVHIGHRRRFWEEAISDLYTKTAVTIESSGQFYGRINWHRIGDVVLSDISSTRSVITRESRYIHPNGDNLFQINFQLEGAGTVIQDGREAVTRPGEVTIYDSSRPYEMRFDGPFRQLSVDFPRRMFEDRLRCSERVTARGLSGTTGPARFLYSYVQALMTGMSDEDMGIADHLQENLLQLLSLALVPLDSASPFRDSDSDHAALSRVKAYIRAHLSDSSLSPSAIAKGQGLSLRKLYYLFEEEGTTIWRFIQNSRLDHCRKDMEDGHMSGRSISDIALTWGFKDSAHFSRTFRHRFGLTPREFRSTCRT